MQKRCDRNRKRSKRRAIFYPIHKCYLDSVSQKHGIYSNQTAHIQQQGIGKQATRRILAHNSEVVFRSHWLEAFWCEECQTVEWYYIRKTDIGYQVAVAPPDLWQRALGVIDPQGNPSVGEFTRRNSKMVGPNTKQFGYF